MDIHTGRNSGDGQLSDLSTPMFSRPSPAWDARPPLKSSPSLQADPRRPLLNRPTQGAYPLGSVMKTLSAAAVADSGVYTLDQRYTCNGRGAVKTISPATTGCRVVMAHLPCRKRSPRAATRTSTKSATSSTSSTLRRSPVICTARVLAQLTGLNDLAESAGLIPDPEWKRRITGLNWTFSDVVNIAIGQGDVQVTPLQVTRWFAAIANGGTLYRPQLVKKVGILGEAPSYTLTPDATAKCQHARRRTGCGA